MRGGALLALRLPVVIVRGEAMPRPATALVTGERASIVRRREMEADVFSRDVVPEHLARAKAYDRGAACLLSTTTEVAQRPRHL